MSNEYKNNERIYAYNTDDIKGTVGIDFQEIVCEDNMCIRTKGVKYKGSKYKAIKIDDELIERNLVFDNDDYDYINFDETIKAVEECFLNEFDNIETIQFIETRKNKGKTIMIKMEFLDKHGMLAENCCKIEVEFESFYK